jgi:hypothetical protein
LTSGLNAISTAPQNDSADATPDGPTEITATNDPDEVVASDPVTVNASLTA